MSKFKGTDKKDNMELNECHGTYDDINLETAKQVQQNIQDIVDER